MTQPEESYYIAFVVLNLHCQLKVVPEGTLRILSESGIEHAKEPLGRALFFSQPSQAETVGHGLGRLSLPKSCQ